MRTYLECVPCFVRQAIDSARRATDSPAVHERVLREVLAAAAEMNARGWVLKVEDGYRTAEMQRGLGREAAIFVAILDKVRWECGGATPPVDLLCRRIGALVANAPKVATHMSGSAMDISVLRRDTGEEVDRGGPYPEMSEKTPMASPFVSAPASANRREITALMSRHGFVTYPWEFWHYNAGDAYAEFLNRTGLPARYGPVHVAPGNGRDGRVTPIDHPTEALNPPAAIRELMNHALTTTLSSPGAHEADNVHDKARDGVPQRDIAKLGMREG